MAKIAILTDSNSGITKDEADSLGVSVIPMPFTIDGQEYLEGISLTQEDFYQRLEKDEDVHTSQPTPGTMMEYWDSLLSDHDEVVYIPMSSGLSSTCENALLFSGEYDGKVQVVNNQRISVTQRQSVLDAKQMAENGKSAKEIKAILEKTRFDSSIYIMVDTLKYLKKGGRVTPAAAAFAEILNLKPILQIQGEKLDSFSKCRGLKQAKSIIISAIKSDVEKRFGGIDEAHPTVWLQVAHTHNDEAARQFAEELQEAFPGHSVHVDPLSLSIACHIGPGSLAAACTKILPEGMQPG
ncbi:MAG: DegV family protein [Lachnospiraceae bacterium]|nr:DegV family protein [Lachnospiraceae bacterium]